MKIFFSHPGKSCNFSSKLEEKLSEKYNTVTIAPIENLNNLADIAFNFDKDDIFKVISNQEIPTTKDIFIYYDSPDIGYPQNLEKLNLTKYAIFPITTGRLELQKELIPIFDKVFCSEYRAYKHFKKEGFKNIEYFPIGSSLNIQDGKILPAEKPKILIYGKNYPYLNDFPAKCIEYFLSKGNEFEFEVIDSLENTNWQETLNKTDIFIDCLPFFKNELSPASFDAMAFGIPVFAPINNVKYPSKNIFSSKHFYSYETFEDLYKSLQNLINNNNIFSLRNNAFSLIKENYNISVNFNQLDFIINERKNNNSLNLIKSISNLTLINIFKATGQFELSANYLLKIKETNKQTFLEKSSYIITCHGLFEDARKKLEKSPNKLNKCSSYLLANLYMAESKNKKAINSFENSFSTWEDNYNSFSWLYSSNDMWERIMSIISDSIYIEGDAQQAIELLNNITNFNSYYFNALLFLNNNNIEKAIEFINKAKQTSISKDNLYTLEAIIKERQGQELESLLLIKKAIELNPFSITNINEHIRIAIKFSKQEESFSIIKTYRKRLDILYRYFSLEESIYKKHYDYLNSIKKKADDFSLEINKEIINKQKEYLNLNICIDPDKVLNEYKENKKPVEIYFRNAASAEFIENLSNGEYDGTNLINKITTEYSFSSAETLLFKNGFYIFSIEANLVDEKFLAFKNSKQLPCGRLNFNRAWYSKSEWDRYFIKSYKILAKPRINSNYNDPISIIIREDGHLSNLEFCINSINQNISNPFEIIIVNSNTNKEITKYLNNQLSSGNIAELINSTNPNNKSAMVNEGLKFVSFDLILLLDSRVLLSDSSINLLIRTLKSSDDIGIVGPMCSSFASPQHESDINYRTSEQFFEFSADYKEKNDNKWFETSRLSGDCMLFKKSLLKFTGNFDERFDSGYFSDDDFSMRTRKEDFRLMVVGDCLIHLFSSNLYTDNNQELFSDNIRKHQNLFIKKWEDINKEFETLLIKNDVKSLIEDAEKWFFEGNESSAITNLLAAIEKEPDNSRAYFTLGLIAEKNSNIQDANSFFIESLKYDPENNHIKSKITATNASLPNIHSSAIMDKIEDLIKNKDYLKAIDFLSSILEKNPNDTLALNNMGLCAWYLGNNSDAYTCFKQAVILDPTFEDGLFNFTDAAISFGLKDEAIQFLETALNSDSSLKEIKKQLEVLKFDDSNKTVDFNKIINVRELNKEAEQLLAEGLIDQANEKIHIAYKLDPNSFISINNLGIIEWYSNNFLNAQDYFKKALDINPVYEDSIKNLFDVSLKLGDISELQDYLIKALKNNPAHKGALNILNHIKLRKEDIFSLENYSQIDSSVDKNKNGFELLANMELDKATIEFLDAIKENGENFESFNGLGIIAFYKKNYNDAYTLFYKAFEFNPLNEDLLLNLFDVAKILELTDFIIPKLKECLEMDPTMTSLSSLLDGLENV